MIESELSIKLAELEERSKNDTIRINKLEADQDALYSIATSVAVLANELKNVTAKVDSIDLKVDRLEKIPANRWNGLVEKLIYAVGGSIVTWILFHFLK